MPQTENTTPPPLAQAVLQYWLQDALALGWPSHNLGAIWFCGGAALDQEIETRFGPQVREAIAGGLTDWENAPLPRLALVLVLDQFSRNIFRGRANAFDGDARAQALVTDALVRDWDRQLPLAGRVFLYTPLMHAESITLQDESVHRFKALLADAAPARLQSLQGHLEYAQQHRDIIAAFGRFPHRNAVLGRANTAGEQEFLTNGPRFGQ